VTDSVFDETTPRPHSDWPGLRTTAAFEGGWSDGSNGRHRPPTNYGEESWRVGWTDGRVAQDTEEHEQILRNQSAYERSQLVLSRMREAEAARAEVSVAEMRQERARVEAERVKEVYSELAQKFRRHRADFSQSVGWLYLIVAFFLFLADLPLSFLAADGLGIRTAIINSAGQRSGVDDLRQLSANWPALWEPLVLAMGLAAMGLFFKLVLDYVFLSDSEESSGRRTLAWIVFGLLTVGAIVAYIYLGDLRAEDKLVAATITAGKPVSLARLQSLGRTAFTLLAVVLPLTGACFFAFGAKKLHNARQLHELRDESKRADDALDTALDQTTRARANLAAAEAALAYARTEPLVSDSLYALYRHGYERGYNAPESLLFGASVYERCRANVERWIGVALQMQNEERRGRRE
jgi:hypothetical protein